MEEQTATQAAGAAQAVSQHSAAFEAVMTMLATYGMQVVGAVVLLIVGLMASRWVRRLTYNALDRIPKFDETLKVFFSSLAKYFVIVITVLAVLSEFGVQTASLVTVFGAASLAIGLALQGTLSSMAAGVMLLIFRPFKVGDYVDAGGVAGTVKEITLFFTQMNTPDNIRITVPNAEVWGKAVMNYSVNKTRRIDLTIGIAYEDDVDKAFKAVEAVLKKEERALEKPEPAMVVGALGPSSVDLILRIWCNRTDFGGLKSDLQKNIKKEFDKKGITIPFPQQVVHMHNAGDADKKKAA